MTSAFNLRRMKKIRQMALTLQKNKKQMLKLLLVGLAKEKNMPFLLKIASLIILNKKFDSSMNLNSKIIRNLSCDRLPEG